MSLQSLEARLEKLEQRVTILEQLPARVDALTLQIVQLREEMHAEFSAVRTEIRAGDEATRDALHKEFQDGFLQLRGELEDTRRVLREEIREGNDGVMSQARTLFEEMKATLAVSNPRLKARASGSTEVD